MHALDRPRKCCLPGPWPAAGRPSYRRQAGAAGDGPLLPPHRALSNIWIAEVDQLDDSTFDQLTAYCEGVNDGSKHSGRSLPMWATGFVPQPWNQKAVLLIGQLLSYGGLAVGQQQNERILLDLIQAGVADDKLRELFSPLLDDADFDLLRQLKISSQLSDEALELITDLPRLAGSNAWAVSPQRVPAGTALLASRSAFGSQPPAGDLVRSGAALGRPLRAGRHAARLPAVRRGPHRAAGVGRHVSEGRHERLLHRRLPARRRDRLAISPRASMAAISTCATRRSSAKASTRRSKRCDVYYNEQGTLESEPQADRPGYYLSSAWIGTSEAPAARSPPGSTWSRPRARRPKRWRSPASARCRR